LEEADLALFVIDARAWSTGVDQEISQWVRQANKPIILVANKAESRLVGETIHGAYSLGLGEPIPVSAVHGLGISILCEAISPYVRAIKNKQENKISPKDILHLTVIGRPNVGKSTLINKLIGEERLLTGELPGITRDIIKVEWEYKGRSLSLIDTAGMRRRAKIVKNLEKKSVEEGLKALKFTQIAILVLDAQMPLEKQDLTIARRVIAEGRAFVLAINKWDLIKEKEYFIDEFSYLLQTHLPQIKGVPFIPISAQKGQNLEDLLDQVFETYRIWNKRITTGPLNRWLQEVTNHHPPPLIAGRQVKVKFITQIKGRPPTFSFFVNYPKAFSESYLKYLINSLRDTFKLPGVPIRFKVRGGKNPYII
jgi:GTP-binding protein